MARSNHKNAPPLKFLKQEIQARHRRERAILLENQRREREMLRDQQQAKLKAVDDAIAAGEDANEVAARLLGVTSQVRTPVPAPPPVPPAPVKPAEPTPADRVPDDAFVKLPPSVVRGGLALTPVTHRGQQPPDIQFADPPVVPASKDFPPMRWAD